MKMKDTSLDTYIHIWTILIVSLCGYVQGKSPADICKREPIHTIANYSQGSGGFEIKFLDLAVENKYRPEQTYTILINGTRYNNITKFYHNVYLGFMLIAMPKNSSDESISMGEFIIPPDGRIKEAPGCNHPVITHRYLMMKRGITLKWKAPKANSGCVVFKASVIENSQTWYKDEGNLTYEICEEDRSTAPQGDATIQDADGSGCCACGGARYSLTFKGHWSRQTHPRNFPHKPEEVVLLHWSRLVGASHSDEYKIWEYGKVASEGVKEICEFGYSNKLETDMKRNSKKILTVVKTAPLWGESQLKKTMHANFNVDQRSHLLSLLSMIGPSPDWCVGVTKLDLCQANCTWADQVKVDLYPWDAGTDSGVDYFSINIATNPRDPIRKITNRNSDPNSPFHGHTKIRPLATLTLTKMKERPCSEGVDDSTSDESAISTSKLIEQMKQKMMIKKKIEMEKCATTLWSDWTGCSVECGRGTRERRRYLKHLQISASTCGVRLNESESCQGPCLEGEIAHRQGGVKELPDNYVVRHQLLEVDESLKEPCARTQWSSWMPCSVSCGRGITQRQRHYVRANESSFCTGLMIEKDICNIDCRNFPQKDYSAICSQPPHVGPCRGSFMRWYFNKEERKCMNFSYGGCRGNDNKFRTLTECNWKCQNATAELQAGLSNQILVDPSASRVTVQRKPDRRRNKKGKKKGKKKGLSKRERKLLRKKNARRRAKMVRKNRQRDRSYDGPAVDCVVTAWTDWSPCSVTCGRGIIIKTRNIEVQAQNGGRRCPRKLMRKRKCKLTKCPVDCQLSEWEDWTPCSQTCGENAVQKRRKRILKKPKRGGRECDNVRLEKRMCVLPQCPNAEMTEMMRDAVFIPPYRYP